MKLPVYAKWCAAERRAIAAASKRINHHLSMQPALPDRGTMKAAEHHLACRAVQYAAWIARRDSLTKHDPDLYQGRYLGAGTVELFHHETSARCEDSAIVEIPNFDWRPHMEIITADEMPAIEAPRAALPSPAQIQAPENPPMPDLLAPAVPYGFAIQWSKAA